MSKLIPLRLDGQGYSISTTPEAKAKKLTVLREAEQIKVVKDNEQAENARYCLKELNDLTGAVEKCRKEVKEPVLEAGRKIDTAAKEFVKELDSQKFRITTLISDHAREQQIKQQEAIRKQQEADAELQRKAREEQEKLEAAEAAAIAAEEALLEATSKKERAKAQALLEESRRKEEEARKATLAAEEAERKEDAAAMVTLAAAAPKGVKPTLDYQVVDIHALYRTHPELCEVTPRRAKILEALKSLQDDGYPTNITGLKTLETFKVSAR